ncbi:MAG: hypothetical protein PHR83_08390 [Paludibacter sp.]|nr:hypothetical protein [Paludibacter sp.]
MKKSGIIVFVFFILVTSCNRPTKQTIYSLVWETPTVLDTNYVANGLSNPNSVRKIKGYYTQFNIIIDTSNVCYYYNNKVQRHGGCCGYGNEFNTPEFLYLDPNKMVVIPNESLAAFLDANLKKDFRGEIYLMVSSPVDTIRQESFRIIAEYEKSHNKVFTEKRHGQGRHLNNKNIIYNVGIRLITEEEKNVLYCKKKNIEYDMANFDWKTKFDNIAPKLTKVNPVIFKE